MFKEKLAKELENLNKVNEEYKKVQAYLQNLEKDILLINGRIQILNELIAEEQQNIDSEKDNSN